MIFLNRFLSCFALMLSPVAVYLALHGQTPRSVDVGGHSLRVLERGRGSPTIVFEAGAGSSLEAWALVQPAVSRFVTTIAYDRAGNGLTEPGPTPRDGGQIARELHTLLRNLRASPPYVLAGHSLGGPYIRAFAQAYPAEVAGLVLVDPTQEELIAWAAARKNLPDPKSPLRLDDEVGCAPMTFASLADSSIPPALPVILITGLGPLEPPPFASAELKREATEDQRTLYPAKLKFHRAWVERAARGRLVITRHSGHGVPWEEPELVVRVIREMVAEIRHQPAPPQ